jgi:cytochrome c-type biogenesis protein CcmE
MTTDVGDTPLDLTPRDVPSRPRRRWGMGLVIGALLLVGGFVLWKGLADASLFFYNVDEAVEMRSELGDDRFNMQGTVIDGTIDRSGVPITFDVTFNGVVASVEHRGTEPGLFDENIPVVLVGRWNGEVFESSEILVKHDEVYVEDNGERLDEAEQGGQVDR